jgi:predicted S18 family serine protease
MLAAVGEVLPGVVDDLVGTDRADPAADVTQSPALALKTLNNAVAKAPADYRDYLVEAVSCYENGLYRAAILMVWAACMEHLYITASGHANGGGRGDDEQERPTTLSRAA